MASGSYNDIFVKMGYKLDTKTIEELGVGAVCSYFLYSDTISPNIPIGDKNPVWDGSLMLYKTKQGKNKNEALIGTIPTQVKSKCNKNIPGSSTKFNITVSDLEIYLRNRGVAYFVVYVNPTNQSTKIFFSLLAPVDLKRYIEQAKSQKSISIQLDALPTLDNQVELEFHNFYDDCRKQSNFTTPIHLKEVEKEIASYKVMFNTTSKDQLYILRYITTHNKFVYVTFKGDPTKTLHPLGDRRYSFKAAREANINISINGKVYFDKCITEIENGNLSITIKDVMTFPFPMELPVTSFSGKVQFNAKFRTLSQQIHVLEFLIAIMQTGNFYVGDIGMAINEIDSNDLSSFQQDLERAKNLKKVFEILHVTEELDISSLTDKDVNNINTLIRYFILNENVVPDSYNAPSWATIEIANISLLFLIEKDEPTGRFTLHSAYDLGKFIFTAKLDDDNMLAIPPYVVFNRETFRDVKNINYSDFLPSFKKTKSNEDKFYQSVNWTILRMLMGYDSQDKKDNNLLNAALELAEWLISINPNEHLKDVYHINYLQIIKRQRALTDSERDILFDILDSPQSSDELKFAAHLLLENYTMAERYFNRLDQDTQKQYKQELPLYSLMRTSTALPAQ